MNPETLDSEYAKLQKEADDVAQAVQAFSQKLQAAANSGDANARDWLLDLKSLAIEIQEEQLQMQSLLQAVHDFTVNHLSQSEPQAQYQPAYAPQPGYIPQPAQQGGAFGRFLGGGFGRAIAMGAGFGLGNDIINSIL